MAKVGERKKYPDSFGARFGRLVQSRRRENVLSLEDLAQELGWEINRRADISNLENGYIRQPHAKTVSLYATVLNISKEEIDACYPSPPPNGVYTLEEHEAKLSKREISLRFELEHAVEQRGLLVKQIEEYEKRQADLKADFDRTLAELNTIKKELKQRSNNISAEKIEAANRALDRGETTLADALLGEAQTTLTRQGQDLFDQAANLAIKRGNIAEMDLRWSDSATHFAEAARLRPDYDNLYKAGQLAWRAGDYPAQAHYRKLLLDYCEQHIDKSDKRLAVAHNEFALASKLLGEYPAAEHHYAKAMKFGEAAIGNDDPEYAAWINNFANLLVDLGRLEEAKELYSKAKEIDERKLGKRHPDTAIDYSNIGECYRRMGLSKKSKRFVCRSLKVGILTLGDDHPSVAFRHHRMAKVLHDLGEVEDARVHFERAIKIGERRLGQDHPRLAEFREDYASMIDVK